MDKEQVPDSVERRGIIYDVYCTTDTGEKIIVEMQNKRQESFKERALYYLSNAIVRQGEKGTKWKYEIKAVYGVFLMGVIDMHWLAAGIALLLWIIRYIFQAVIVNKTSKSLGEKRRYYFTLPLFDFLLPLKSMSFKSSKLARKENYSVHSSYFTRNA